MCMARWPAVQLDTPAPTQLKRQKSAILHVLSNACMQDTRSWVIGYRPTFVA